MTSTADAPRSRRALLTDGRPVRGVPTLAALLALLLVLAVAPSALGVTPPTNDDPAHAIPLTPGVTVDWKSDTATEAASDPTDCNGSNGPFPGPYYASVWFSYTPANSGTVYVDPPTITGDPDDFLAITFVFAVSGGTRTLIDCRAYGNDASWNAVAGTKYLIMVAGLDTSVTGDPDLSDRGGHGTITLFAVSGNTLRRSFEGSGTFDLGCPNVDLTESFQFRSAGTIFFAADGSISRVMEVFNFGGVITNQDTGQTYRDPDHGMNVTNLAKGTFTQLGLNYAITIPGQGVVVLDAGFISFDSAGNVLVRGPHALYYGFDICQILA